MSTVVVQIGNTDNKLTQQEWSEFYDEVDRIMRDSGTVHFAAPSVGSAPWQNACWAVTLHAPDTWYLRKRLRNLAADYQQDSIAFLVGETEFVEASR